MLPVACRRCIHLIVELGLTSNQSAASRRDAPCWDSSALPLISVIGSQMRKSKSARRYLFARFSARSASLS
jgi:hypothetical protein